MTQAEFQLKVGDSQANRILAHLQARRDQWVPMPELWRVSGAMAVHSRIADLNRKLRGQELHIANWVDRSKKPFESFYRLETAQTF